MANTYSKMVMSLKKAIDYQFGGVSSKTIVDNSEGSLVLYALDENQLFPQQIALQDTVVQSIEGEVFVTMADNELLVKEGEIILIPQNETYIIHSDTRTKIIIYVA